VEHRDRVYFLAKAPHWAFVWWELSAESRARAADAAGPGGQLVLRVEEVVASRPGAGAAPLVFDVPIIGATDHWYLHVPATGRTYRVQVGFCSPLGELHAMAASSAASVPPAGPSDHREEVWSTVPIRERRWTARAI
jgi:hypothetical protein